MNRSRESLVEELGRRGRKLAEAQSIAKTGSWEFTAHDQVLQWSDELFRVPGFEPGSIEPTGETLFERLHPDDREVVEAAYAAMGSVGTPKGFDVRLRPVPGQPIRWVRCADAPCWTLRGPSCVPPGPSRTSPRARRPSW